MGRNTEMFDKERVYPNLLGKPIGEKYLRWRWSFGFWGEWKRNLFDGQAIVLPWTF